MCVCVWRGAYLTLSTDYGRHSPLGLNCPVTIPPCGPPWPRSHQRRCCGSEDCWELRGGRWAGLTAITNCKRLHHWNHLKEMISDDTYSYNGYYPMDIRPTWSDRHDCVRLCVDIFDCLTIPIYLHVLHWLATLYTYTVLHCMYLASNG